MQLSLTFFPELYVDLLLKITGKNLIKMLLYLDIVIPKYVPNIEFLKATVTSVGWI